jgi:nucleoside 2-deoxyribosyltransferase
VGKLKNKTGKMTVYLAGAIRGPEDYVWRKQFVEEYKDELLFRIPSDLATLDVSKLRKFGPAAYMTYRTDLDLIDRSDIVVANLLPMASGYPSMGTMFEIGYSRAKGKLIFIVADDIRKAHPFIAFGGDGVYPSFEELGVFFHQYLGVLRGGCPVFDQI